MATPLSIAQSQPLPAASLEAARQAAETFAKASRAASTWRAYESDWRLFMAWCAGVGCVALPAEAATVALFLASQAKLGIAPATLSRRLAAIRLMHLGARVASPHAALEVNEVMRGIRRAWKRPVAQKAPAVDEEIKRMVDAVEAQTLKGLRERALLLLGFAGAFRRSELIGLDTQHLTQRAEGLEVLIANSKTDQEGAGQMVAVARVAHSPYCPVQAVSDWLVAADISTGAVFRTMHRGDTVGKTRLSAQSVALIVKGLAAKAGLEASRYAGHSLRSGFLTSAARNRASIFKMAEQSRHKSLDVLREYVRDEERFEDHAAEGLLRSGPRA
ncbi:MAG TPA: tyrosine-type recombinase/integrase [Steroidobacteraceae bacterium]